MDGGRIEIAGAAFIRGLAGAGDAVYAVGPEGSVIKWQSGTWSTARRASASSLNRVWNHSENFAIAVAADPE